MDKDIFLNEKLERFNLVKFSEKLIRYNIFLIFIIIILFLIYEIKIYNNFTQIYYKTSMREFQANLSPVSISNINLISKFVEKKLSEKWVKGVWICDNKWNLLYSSDDYINSKYQGAKFSPYKSIYTYLWKFDNKGDVVPILRNNLKFNMGEVIFPVYNNNEIKFFCGIKFYKYIFSPFFIFQKDIPVYFYIIEILLILFIIIFVFTLFINVVLKKIALKDEKKLRSLISGLYKLPLDNKDIYIKYEEKYKHNIIVEFIKFVNYLLNFYSKKIEYISKKDLALRKIIPPLIFSTDKSKDKSEVKLIVKADEKDINKLLIKEYYNENDLTSIKGYSWSIYHYGKEEKRNIIVKFLDIFGNRKAFFVASLKNNNDKRFMLEFLNYYLKNKSSNLTNSYSYLSELNTFLHRFGEGRLWFHIFYALLDTDTNYFEVSSTKFSPLILYKADEKSSYYYEFDGIPVGAKKSDEFQEKLKKEVFRLSVDDIIIIFNKEFEKLKNFDGMKFEMYEIVKVLKDNPDTSAEILKDKIIDTLNKFSVDYSTVDELFFLILKRNSD